MRRGKKIMGGLGCLIPILLIIHTCSPGGITRLHIPEGYYLHSFDLEGKRVFEKHFKFEDFDGGRQFPPVFLQDSSIVVNSSSSELTCFEPGGEERWSYNPGQNGVLQGFTYVENNLVLYQYMIGEETEVHALSETGELAWVYSIGEDSINTHQVAMCICVSGGFTFISGRENLHFVNKDGKGGRIDTPGKNNWKPLVPGIPGQILIWDQVSLLSVGPKGVNWTFVPNQAEGEVFRGITFAANTDTTFVATTYSKPSGIEQRTHVSQLDHTGKEILSKRIPDTGTVWLDNSGGEVFLVSYDSGCQLSHLDFQGRITRLDPPKEFSLFVDDAYLFCWDGAQFVYFPSQLNIEPVSPEITLSPDGAAAIHQGKFPEYFLEIMNRQTGFTWLDFVRPRNYDIYAVEYFAPNGNLVVDDYYRSGMYD